MDKGQFVFNKLAGPGGALVGGAYGAVVGRALGSGISAAKTKASYKKWKAEQPSGSKTSFSAFSKTPTGKKRRTRRGISSTIGFLGGAIAGGVAAKSLVKKINQRMLQMKIEKILTRDDIENLLKSL